MNRPRKIVVATRNAGKLREIREILKKLPLEIVSLAAYPGAPEVVEDGLSYLENARKKARAISEYTREWALADDSGLEVDALQGRPGIHSARYAGEAAGDEENCRKLLDELKAAPAPHRACFRCVIVLFRENEGEMIGEGRLQGEIIEVPRGEKGFGYDSLFCPEKFENTLGELSAEEKNQISHRTAALKEILLKL